MNEDKPTGNPWMKNLLVWGGIIMVVLLVISMFNARTDAQATLVPYSDFRARVADGSVESVQIGETKITGK